jgi:glycerophosphoryl diester phosphodiesterase
MEPLISTGALINDLVEDPIKLLTDLKADALHPHFSLVASLPLRKMRKKGLAIMAWTVNETEIMQAMINACVSGIITDYPQELALLMKKNASSTY